MPERVRWRRLQKGRPATRGSGRAACAIAPHEFSHIRLARHLVEAGGDAFAIRQIAVLADLPLAFDGGDLDLDADNALELRADESCGASATAQGAARAPSCWPVIASIWERSQSASSMTRAVPRAWTMA